jgi:DNA-binding MarR family transcriptional regulator
MPQSVIPFATDSLVVGYEDFGGANRLPPLRQIAMDLLYRAGGLSGTEIGEMMGVDYSTVSLGRKRLREKLKSNKYLS